MNSGDFVYVSYVGRVKDTGEIFDLTEESVAKEEKIFNQNLKYGPVPAVIDAGFVIKGLEEALKEMKVGEKKTVEIKPEKAFGERSVDLIKLIPMSKFNEQNVEATPGAFVVINGIRGRVVSVAGGRVKVDFNHPLAGKTLEYEIEIKEEIKEVKEKIKAIVFYFTGIENVEIGLSDKEVEIAVKADVSRGVKESIAKNIMEWVGLEKVKFVDVFT